MKNILITGGAGFIGSSLSLRLIKTGHSVRVLDNLSPQIHGDNPPSTSPLYISIKDKVEFIKGSVTEKTDWEAAIRDQHVIVHLAAETGTGQSMYQVEHYTDVNIKGTALLIDILANQPHTISKVIVASSRAVYGEGKYFSPELGIVYPSHRSAENMSRGDFEVKYPGAQKLFMMATDESSRLHPSSVYGITKQVQEQLIMSMCPSLGISAVSFRYQNVYGPGQSLSNPYTGILSIFSSRIKTGQKINIFEDGEESRDFVFIDDVVQATTAGIESESANNRIFNVGTGKATSVMTVARMLMEKLGLEVPLEVSGMYRIGDIRHNCADISHLGEILAIRPEIDFSEGIGRFAAWVQTQSPAGDKYEHSLEEMKKKGLLK